MLLPEVLRSVPEVHRSVLRKYGSTAGSTSGSK